MTSLMNCFISWSRTPVGVSSLHRTCTWMLTLPGARNLHCARRCCASVHGAHGFQCRTVGGSGPSWWRWQLQPTAVLHTRQLQPAAGLYTTAWRPVNAEDHPPHQLPSLVYVGNLESRMRRVKMFSFFTSCVALAISPTMFFSLAKSGTALAVTTMSVMFTCTLLTPIMIHCMVKNYVTKCRYYPEDDAYMVETITFFLFRRITRFKVEEVEVPEVDGIFTTFRARGRSFFVDGRLFNPVEHFGRIMKYETKESLQLSLNTSQPVKADGDTT